MKDAIVSLNTQTHTYTAPTHALMHVYPHMKESPCVLSVVNMMLSWSRFSGYLGDDWHNKPIEVGGGGGETQCDMTLIVYLIVLFAQREFFNYNVDNVSTKEHYQIRRSHFDIFAHEKGHFWCSSLFCGSTCPVCRRLQLLCEACMRIYCIVKLSFRWAMCNWPLYY